MTPGEEGMSIRKENERSRPHGLFVFAVVFDAVAKAAAWAFLSGTTVSLPFGAFLRLHANPGVAFGMAGSWGGALGVVGVAILLYLTYVVPLRGRAGRYGLALLWAGGLSNAVERLALGGVTDFLFLPLGLAGIPGLFVNIADLWVGLGVCLLAADVFRQRDGAEP